MSEFRDETRIYLYGISKLIIMIKKILLLCLFLLLIISIVSAAPSLKYGDGTILIAKGDDIEFSDTVTGSSSAWIWLFAADPKNNIYGEPVPIIGGQYYVRLPNSTFGYLNYGKYKIIIQLSGRNTIQEVTYNRKLSSFDSPWRYGPKPLEISPSSIVASKQLISRIQGNMSDDDYIEKDLTIMPAVAYFKEMHIVQNDRNPEYNGLLRVTGTTNLNPLHQFVIMIDHEDEFNVVIDWREFDSYSWHAEFPIVKYKPGSHSVILKTGVTEDMETSFQVYEYFPTPTPTPIPKRYISSQYLPVIVDTTPEITETQLIPSKPKFVAIVTDTQVSTPVATSTPIAARSDVTYIAPKKTNEIVFVEHPTLNLDTFKRTKIVPVDNMTPIAALMLIILAFGVLSKK